MPILCCFHIFFTCYNILLKVIIPVPSSSWRYFVDFTTSQQMFFYPTTRHLIFKESWQRAGNEIWSFLCLWRSANCCRIPRVLSFHHISSYFIIFHYVSSYFIMFHDISSYFIIFHHILSFFIHMRIHSRLEDMVS